MKSRTILLTAIILCLIMITCGEDNPSAPDTDPDTTPPDNPDLVSEEIGPAGGILTSSDDKLTLTIPEGALSATETITIEAIEADDLSSEFDEIAKAIGIKKAWELGPDGMEFDVPVTAGLSLETPEQKNDGRLEIEMPLLYTSQNDTPELLDSLSVNTEENANTATLVGQLSHFSPLLETEVWGKFIVNGVPDEARAGDMFEVTVDATVLASISPPDDTIETVTYTDGSTHPLLATNIERLQPVNLSRTDDGSNESLAQFSGTFEYSCEEDGEGAYFVDLHTRYIVEEELELRTRFAKLVKCTPSEHLLSVKTDGDGSGAVTSDPAGIDCGEKCDQKYPSGTTVILTAKTDGNSRFDGWEGVGTTNSENENVRSITMDADKEITAIFTATETITVLDLGLFSVDIEVSFNEYEALLSLLSDDDDQDKSLAWVSKDGAFNTDEASFGSITGTFPVAVAGAEGFVVVDLLTGEVLMEETGFSNTGPFFGVAGITREPPGENTPAILEAFGQNGSVFTRFDKFGALPGTSTTFDAFPAGGGVVSNVMTIVRPQREIGFWVFDANQGIYVTAESGAEFDDSLFEGELLSAYMHSDVLSDNVVPQPRGSFLVLTRGTESKLYLASWDPKEVTEVESNIGLDARKVRCIEDGSGTGNLVCAVSVFGDSRLAILTWDRETMPELAGFADVGDGPVGIDLRLLANGNVAIVSTGFNHRQCSVQ